MGIKVPALAAGEEFIAGRSQAKAKELLELADAAGLKGSVRTTYSGYIVPSSILASDAQDVDPDALAAAEAEKAAAEAAAAEAAAAAAEETPEGEPAAVEFDPSTATVDAVKEYLDGADDEERARVLEVEAASAKPRKGILDLATVPEGAK